MFSYNWIFRAGKTTCILNFLKNKPKNERWAILVNEFGEIGLDGSLYRGQCDDDQAVFIREVPGGCMRCSSGVSMRRAIDVLLTKAQPDRLFIEPTGLGHPYEILNTLRSKVFREKVSVRQIVCIVDARMVSLDFYANNSIFKEHISIADVIVANKADLYQEKDEIALKEFVSQHGSSHAKVIKTQHAKFKMDYLQGLTLFNFNRHFSELKHHDHFQDIDELPLPSAGYIKIENKGSGYKSIGWRFMPYFIFNREKLMSFFAKLNIERMKAIFITTEGIFAFNFIDTCLTETEYDECAETRIEIISKNINQQWEKDLFNCLESK